VLDKFGGKMFEAGVEEALQNLKRRAEERYRNSVVDTVAEKV
jgi:hypothetical protein